jgi:hypothetical protein
MSYGEPCADSISSGECHTVARSAQSRCGGRTAKRRNDRRKPHSRNPRRRAAIPGSNERARKERAAWAWEIWFRRKVDGSQFMPVPEEVLRVVVAAKSHPILSRPEAPPPPEPK